MKGKAVQTVDQPWAIREYFSFEFEILEQIRFVRILGNNLKYLKTEYFIAIDNLHILWLKWISPEIEELITEFWGLYSDKKIDALRLYDAMFIFLIFDIDERVNLLTKSLSIPKDKLLVVNKK